MSDFDGNRSSTVTPFATNPTAESSALDVAVQPLEGIAFDEDDLAMFTNTHFFDFDLDETVTPAAAGSDADDRPVGGVDTLAPPRPGRTGLDLLREDFHLTDITSFQTLLTEPSSLPVVPPPVQVPHLAYAMPAMLSPVAMPATAATPMTMAEGLVTSPPTGDKHKADATTFIPEERSGPGSPDGAARLAAEEDKRRRNTAASARFRIKKKQREQTLERTAKEMTDKVNQLEARIGQLETENKWLKNLITEKNGKNDDVTELWHKRSASQMTATTATSAKMPTTKDGVGGGRAAGSGTASGKKVKS